MRIVFAGTPAFAARSLEALIAAGHAVVAVLAQPDRPAGRGLQLEPGAVKALALRHAIPVLQPRGLRLDGRFGDDARIAHDVLRATPHDLMVVAAYGLILPPSILALPPRGCVNVHASLLPRWRGAAPIQRAIEAGDRETGITIMQMDAGLDTGDMLLSQWVAIGDDETAGQLTERLATLGGRVLVDALARLADGAIVATPQPASGVTYAAKLSKAESPIDFANTSRAIVDRIRAFDPWPGSSAELIDPSTSRATPFRIWAARPLPIEARGTPGDVLAVRDDGIAVATGDGAVLLTALQKPGGRRLPATTFATEIRPPLRFGRRV